MRGDGQSTGAEEGAMAAEATPDDITVATKSAPRRLPRWVRVHRRGPILRPARASLVEAGIFGIDLTAGCGHGCAFCHIRGSALYPGDDRVLFDPDVSAHLGSVLDAPGRPPRLVVLSPTSDPLPPNRELRALAVRVVRMLLGRGIEVLLMTRGRVPAALIEVMAAAPDLSQVALGLNSLDRGLVRRLEPLAAPPLLRLRGLTRLIEAGVRVEVRLEPLIAGLTDTRENLMPLFATLGRAGVRRVVAHYLFLHPAMTGTLNEALTPLGLAEKLADAYEGGPVFPVGTLGPTKHLPLETRRAGLACLTAWGAEHGLLVETGAAQNPDLRRAEAPGPAASAATMARTSHARRWEETTQAAPMPT
jgi:DNA repair photolyase